MKSPLVVSLLALALSVVALVATLLKSSPSQARAEGALLPVAADPDAELLARLEALAEEDRKLRDRLASLELRPDREPRTPVTDELDSEEELAALRDEVRRLAEQSRVGTWNPGDPPPREFTERVQQSMREIEVQKAIDRAAQQVESRLGRLKRQMPQVSEKLGLTPQQEVALESALGGIYEKQASYGVLYAQGEVSSREELGPINKSNMEEFLSELNGFMNPQQYQAYLSLSGDLFPGAKGGGGR